jgi:hypothetical protein
MIGNAVIEIRGKIYHLVMTDLDKNDANRLAEEYMIKYSGSKYSGKYVVEKYRDKNKYAIYKREG